MGLWILGISLCVAVVVLSVGAALNARAQRRVVERVATQATERAAKRMQDVLVHAFDAPDDDEE